ncbi:hypothetical protein GCM10027277_14920 [Pseudoduganella ginsengisoli]|nr:DUF4214 domain-containing protein [Pseudoduganella ginsengisoli]
MATVAINFSQATIDALAAQRASAPAAPTLGKAIDQVIQAGYSFSANHYFYSDILLATPESWLTYPDGGYQYFYGMTKTGATSGAITATMLEDYAPDAYRLVYEGQLKFSYTTNADNGVVLTNEGGAVTRVTLESRLAPDDAKYDKVFGNTTTVLSGTLSSDNAVQFNSTINAINLSADNVLASAKIAGTINASGNTADVGLGTSSAMLSGTVTSLQQTYTDGSTFTFSGTVAATSAMALDERLLSDSTYFSGNDTISVTMPATLPTAYAVNSGDGNDRITITGGGSMLSANGGNGDDTFVLGDHGHTVTGGAGMDSAIFSGARASYAVAASTTVTGTSTVAAIGGATDTLSGIERIQFDNAYVALDIAGNAGEVFRLYQAAFNRVPDLGGLGYWIKQVDNGLALQTMARYFTESAEFQALYGANPANDALVTSFYHNALHRDPDAGGFAYWLDVLNRKLVSTSDMLGFFSDSAENQAAVLPAILTGIAYTPYN